MIERTPLEKWIKKKMLLNVPEFNREILECYQLNRFIQQLSYVKENCLFYKELLADVNAESINALGDIKKISFTTDEDVKKHSNKMVCASQEEISRIVTLMTSGTTDTPKRIYFTIEDQELTKDFFHIGMSTYTRPKDKVLILLPGSTPGSVGDLLKIGLKRMGAEGIIYGVVDEPKKVEQIIIEEGINGIVGIPQQVLDVCQLENAEKIRKQGFLRNILLSTDYVAESIISKIQKNWGCTVYEHYGMTEMGLGGGVFCQALAGYHLREADMIFEIVDAHTGMSVEDGKWGEVVFTTLTRKAMPLIRYRTGDISRFIEKPCSCGTILKTMDKIQYRMASGATLSNGYMLTMSALEEMLFDIDGMIDFDAKLTLENYIDCLNINAHMLQPNKQNVLSAIEKSEIGKLVTSGKLKINIQQQLKKEVDIKAMKKRKIIDKRRVE